VNAKEFEESDRGTFEAAEGQNEIDVHNVRIIQKRWMLWVPPANEPFNQSTNSRN
jgi:hypothetical protein